MPRNTNSFTIAQYILLFLVAALCIGIVAWTMISAHRQMQSDNAAADVRVIHISNNDPCVQEITNTVSQMWAYNLAAVPQEYLNMVGEYANEQITTRTHGSCNDVAFVCRPGQLRRECDPCAIASGREIAINRQIEDMVQQQCTNK